MRQTIEEILDYELDNVKRLENTVPAGYIPDKIKQTKTRKELNRLYNLSRWYSVRYAAGKALGDDKVDELLDKRWIGESRFMYNDIGDIVRLYKISGSEKVKGYLEKFYNNPKKDKKQRKKAGKALGYWKIKIWYNLLKDKR